MNIRDCEEHLINNGFTFVRHTKHSQQWSNGAAIVGLGNNTGKNHRGFQNFLSEVKRAVAKKLAADLQADENRFDQIVSRTKRTATGKVMSNIVYDGLQKRSIDNMTAIRKRLTESEQIAQQKFSESAWEETKIEPVKVEPVKVEPKIESPKPEPEMSNVNEIESEEIKLTRRRFTDHDRWAVWTRINELKSVQLDVDDILNVMVRENWRMSNGDVFERDYVIHVLGQIKSGKFSLTSELAQITSDPQRALPAAPQSPQSPQYMVANSLAQATIAPIPAPAAPVASASDDEEKIPDWVLTILQHPKLSSDKKVAILLTGDFMKTNSSALKKKKAREYYKQNRKKLLEIARQYREQNKEKRRETVAKYRAQNKEKVREYYEQNRARILEKSREHYARNKEKRRETQRQYRVRNNEKLREYQRGRSEETLVARAEYQREYFKRNKAKILERRKQRIVVIS